MTAPPRPSVGIVSCRAFELLRRAVDVLDGQRRAAGAELVIARAGGPEEAARARAAFPDARVVEAPADAGVPRLRGLALAAATGDPVAMLEDHCCPAEEWLPGLVRRMADGADVVGGGMANAPGSEMISWGAYLADYGFYSCARPAGDGGVPLMTAANIAYARRVVPDVAAWCLEGAWENVVHDRLAAQGRVLRFAPEVLMYHDHRYAFGPFWRDRLEHGWDYARARLTEHPGARRWQLTALAPLLPPVLLARIVRAAWREDPLTVLLAAPVTMALLSGWALGEALGYLKGPLGAGEETGRVAAS